MASSVYFVVGRVTFSLVKLTIPWVAMCYLTLYWSILRLWLKA